MRLRFKLNHLYQGQNAPFLYAADAGLFEQAGIDLVFVEGFSSSQVTRALLSGEADLGFGDVTSVLEASIRSGSAPIRVLMPIYVRSPCSLGYHRRPVPLTLAELDDAVAVRAGWRHLGAAPAASAGPKRPQSCPLCVQACLACGA